MKSDKFVTLPDGIKPSTLRTYRSEWMRYVRFGEKMTTSLPGRDREWDPMLLWAYMAFRAQSCCPATVVSNLSALAHFGITHGFVLPTSKYDGNPLLRHRVIRMKRQVALDRRSTTQCTYTPDRCTALGAASVGLLLSAFKVRDRHAFWSLSRAVRHNLAACVMQCTCGMRFGHFVFRRYTRDSFLRDPEDGSFRLITDWHRYAGRHRFVLEFPAFLKWKCQTFTVRAFDGSVIDTFSAATLLTWHFEQLEQADEQLVFAPQGIWPACRDTRQRWLRDALLRALPLNDQRARRLVEEVTPHSFRPGIAGDLFREGASVWQIAFLCRWHSMQAVRLYTQRPSLSMARTSSSFRLIDTRGW